MRHNSFLFPFLAYFFGTSVLLLFIAGVLSFKEGGYRLKIVIQNSTEFLIRMGIVQAEGDLHFGVRHPAIVKPATNVMYPSIYGFDVSASVCRGADLNNLSACYAVTQNEELLPRIVEKLNQFVPASCSAAANKGNGWLLALFLDQLPAGGPIAGLDSTGIHQRLLEHLSQCLAVLDGDNASLWHGRFSLGAEAFLVAGVLPDEPEFANVKARAFSHFMNSVYALSLTEAWPGGYNYWINSRALTFLFASDLLLNGLQGHEKEKTLVQELLLKVGLWHIYMTRPDHRFAAIGDDGPRVDLKDETLKIIDYLYKLTGNPVFSRYADYILTLHGQAAYYSGHRWMIPFLASPRASLKSESKQSALASVGHLVPDQHATFGSGAYNQVVVRSGWGGADTFFETRAPAMFSHHQHYDAGHFTLFKRAPIFVDSSVYFGTQTENRLYYSIRSLAKNTILVDRPGDIIQPNPLFKFNINEGGQRLQMPTGSAIQTVASWKANLIEGQHFSAGKMVAFTVDKDSGVYRIQQDLTDAYDNTLYDSQQRGGKVSKVLRDFVYHRPLDVLIIRDRVWPTDVDYEVTTVFHTLTEPRLQFREDAGVSLDIMLDGKPLAKMDAFSNSAIQTEVIGGPGKEYWVKVDGRSEGINFSGGVQIKPWFDNPAWRVEYSGKSTLLEKPIERAFIIQLDLTAPKATSFDFTTGQAFIGQQPVQVVEQPESR